MKWCLDMPSLTYVHLSSTHAFRYKDDVTIIGSTHFIPLSRIDIGALQSYFNWSPRGAWLLSLCHTPTTPLPIHLRAHSAALERALSLCEHGNNDDPHLKWWKSNQNRGNDNKWSFLQIARNAHQNKLQITHIASTLKSEADPNQANPLNQSQKHHHSISFHSYNPLNAMKSESSPSSTQSKPIIQTQLPYITISPQQLKTQSVFKSTHNHSNPKNYSPITISIPP